MANWHCNRYNCHWEKLQYPDRRGYITEEEQVTSQSQGAMIYQYFHIPFLAEPQHPEITENRLSGPQHPPKVKYNNKQNISFQDHYEQHLPKVKYSLPGPPHLPKVKYFPEIVPKLVIR